MLEQDDAFPWAVDDPGTVERLIAKAEQIQSMVKQGLLTWSNGQAYWLDGAEYNDTGLDQAQGSRAAQL